MKEFLIYAYGPDENDTVYLTTMPFYEMAVIAAKIYLPLIEGEIMLNNNSTCIATVGEPFTGILIVKPNGEKEIITC